MLGPSLDAALALFRIVIGTLGARRPRVAVWGGSIDGAEAQPVPHDHIILPNDLKKPLLDYLDRYWRLHERATELGVNGRRGVLLVGPAGCGKIVRAYRSLGVPMRRPQLLHRSVLLAILLSRAARFFTASGPKICIAYSSPERPAD